MIRLTQIETRAALMAGAAAVALASAAAPAAAQ